MRALNPPEPDPDPNPLQTPSKTLDLVWAKTSKSQPWWPARVVARSPGRVHVSRFGSGDVATTHSCHVSQVKPFFNPHIVDMACRNQSGAFFSAFHEAVRFASLYLQFQLTCCCVPPEARPLDFTGSSGSVQIGICNFTGLEFVNRVRDAALSVWAVDVGESVRLKSWVFALAQGLCNGQVGFNQRKLVADLVDKFDIDLDACAHDDDDGNKVFGKCNMMDGNMGLQDNLTNGGINGVSKPTKKKKKRVSQSDNVLEKESTGAGVGVGSGSGATSKDEEPTSGRRERKKSKYLSPPYTDVVGLTTHKQSEQELDDGKTGEKDGEGADKDKGNVVDFETFSVQDIFTDFFFTCLDPLYLKRKRSAKVFRLFFNKYRDTVFVEGTMHKSYKNYKCKCQMKRKVNVKAHLDNGLGSSFESCLEPKIDRSDLTTGQDAFSVDRELVREKEKDKFDSGVCLPKKCGRPENEENCQSSLGSNMPNVEKSELKIERKDLTGSVSSVPLKVNISIGGNTILNFAKKSYEFLDEARAQMLQTGSLENGNKPAETGEQFQEQCSLKKRKTGNGDSPSGAEPKQRDQMQKAAQAHYPNPAALLFDFSKTNVANGFSMSADLPSRDQLLSTFSKFGPIVETQSDVHRDLHTARVVFERSTDAEAAFNSSDKLGPFGCPFATCCFQYLPPISANLTPPANQLSAKPQLSVIRKNLEMMISSLTGTSALPVNGESSSTLNGIRPKLRGSLVEEMQGLLMKVEKRLGGSGASSSATVPGVPPP